jgi:hypothetical protein
MAGQGFQSDLLSTKSGSSSSCSSGICCLANLASSNISGLISCTSCHSSENNGQVQSYCYRLVHSMIMNFLFQSRTKPILKDSVLRLRMTIQKNLVLPKHFFKLFLTSFSCFNSKKKKMTVSHLTVTGRMMSDSRR